MSLPPRELRGLDGTLLLVGVPPEPCSRWDCACFSKKGSQWLLCENKHPCPQKVREPLSAWGSGDWSRWSQRGNDLPPGWGHAARAALGGGPLSPCGDPHLARRKGQQDVTEPGQGHLAPFTPNHLDAPAPFCLQRPEPPRRDGDRPQKLQMWRVRGQGMAVMARTFHLRKSCAPSSHLHPDRLPTLLCRMSQLCPQLHRWRAHLSNRPGAHWPALPLPSTDAGGRSGWWGVCSMFVSIKSKANTEVT